MKKDDLFKAIGEIDDVYLNQSEVMLPARIKSHWSVKKTLVSAAALVLLCGTALILPKAMFNSKVNGPINVGFAPSSTDSSDNSGLYETTSPSDEIANNTIHVNDDGSLSVGTGDDEIISIINQNLDVIIEGSENFTDEEDYVNANGEAFENIVALGEDALPYLQELAKKGNFYDITPENNRCIIAIYLSYLIDPELYDMVYLSPDGKYSITATVDSFFTMHDPFTGISYILNLVNNSTGSVIATASNAYSIVNSSGAALISWSPDSKYAIFEESYRHLYTNVILFDTTASSCRALFDEGALETFASADFVYTSPDGIVWDRLHCNFDKWGYDSLKITLSLASAAGGRLMFGSYVYDIRTESATQLVYDLDLDEQWEQNFGPSEDNDPSILTVDDVKIPIPPGYVEARIISFDIPPLNDGNILVTLYNVEERGVNGDGEICTIYRLTHAEYEHDYAIYEKYPNVYNVLAKDEAYYYFMRIPADLQSGTAPNATKFTPIRRECVTLIEEKFGDLNNIGVIWEPTDTDMPTRTNDGHKYYLFYPEGKGSGHFSVIVLSQPVKQGEGGIWCVERWEELVSGTPGISSGENELMWVSHEVTPWQRGTHTVSEYYECMQEYYDNGEYQTLGDPESVLLAWGQEEFGDAFFTGHLEEAFQYPVSIN